MWNFKQSTDLKQIYALEKKHNDDDEQNYNNDIK